MEVWLPWFLVRRRRSEEVNWFVQCSSVRCREDGGAMVVRDGAVAGCGMALVRELWRPEVHCGGCCVRKKNSRWFRDDGGKI